MRVQKVAAVLLGALLGIGALTGCGSESNDPDPVDWESNSDKQDKENADQTSEQDGEPAFPNQDASEAATAWLDASNKALETLDPEPMLARSAPGCKNCEHFADYVTDLKENGGKLEGDFAHVVRGAKAPEVDGKTASVNLTVERGAWTEISEAGASPKKYEPETYDAEIDLRMENGSWIVTEMVLRPQE